MIFTSPEFIIFSLLVIPTYFLLSIRLRWLLLLVASYCFYASWDIRYLVLIIFSTLIDYFAALTLDNDNHSETVKKLLLGGSLVTNLGILFIFKYYNFFIESAITVLHHLNIQASSTTLDVLLPIGISFYTFQSMAYTIDVYRKRIPAEKHLGIFALYVAFFPQLVAGPIERAQNIIPQFKTKYSFNYVRFVEGMQLIIWGAFKKVAIADRVAPYVEMVYANPEAYHGNTIILAILFFTFQIYCDFSGYSDIAIGIAKIMGYDLMENFRQPYFAKSLRQFWARWHISLSTWFRDYLYIPLGGNRLALSQNLLNILLVFLISGLWHGANWTFVFWGFLHGFFVMIETFMLKRNMRILPESIPRRLRNFVCWVCTILFVCIAFVFFRAENMNSAFSILSNIFSSTGINQLEVPFGIASRLTSITELYLSVGFIILVIIMDYLSINGGINRGLMRFPRPIRHIIYYGLVGAILFTIIFSGINGADFIYFQF